MNSRPRRQRGWWYDVPSIQSAVSGLGPVATTGPTGFALQNGTPSIISWTTPSDGNLHRVTMFITWDVTSTETGGAFGMTWTAPDGGAGALALSAGGSAAGAHTPTPFSAVCRAGTTVTLAQTSALTGGAATLWAEMWGS
jgi:hypothetical protein